VLGERDAELVGHDNPPPDAFAAISPHESKWDRKGSVTWSDAPEAADHFVVDDVKFEKNKELKLTARVGKRKAEITIALGSDAK